jgi:transcription elongation factor Elf1
MTDQFLKIFETAQKLKQVMLKKKLTRAKAKCPHCEHGILYGTLNGHKNHLHMKCSSCPIVLME